MPTIPCYSIPVHALLKYTTIDIRYIDFHSSLVVDKHL